MSPSLLSYPSSRDSCEYGMWDIGVHCNAIGNFTFPVDLGTFPPMHFCTVISMIMGNPSKVSCGAIHVSGDISRPFCGNKSDCVIEKWYLGVNVLWNAWTGLCYDYGHGRQEGVSLADCTVTMERGRLILDMGPAQIPHRDWVRMRERADSCWYLFPCCFSWHAQWSVFIIRTWIVCTHKWNFQK